MGFFPKDKEFWQTKATADADKVSNCCLTKATCKMGVCGAGTKKKAGVDDLSCAKDAASCAWLTLSPCCEADPATCGGLEGTITCATGFYDESATGWDLDPENPTPKAVKDAWRNKPATAATKNTACCTARAACTAAPAATTTPPATTTPATPALKFSEHKVATEEGSSNMVWLGAGAMIGMGVLMIVQGLRSRRLDRGAME